MSLYRFIHGARGGGAPPTPCDKNWEPDPNWPTPPAITAANERFWGIYAVFENANNIVTVTATNLAANIDWGDGTSVVSNGAAQTHTYDYATIAATAYTFQDGRNVKYVTVDITRVGGAILALSFRDLSTSNSFGGSFFLDVLASLPNTTSSFVMSQGPVSGTKAMSLVQRVRLKAIGLNCFLVGSLQGMPSLRVLEWPYSTTADHRALIATSGNVDDVGNVDWGSNTLIGGAIQNSRIKKHGNLIANSATTSLDSYATDCLLLSQFGDITATACTTLARFFGNSTGSPMLTRVGTINAPLCQSIQNMFFRCFSLAEAIFVDCAAITTTSGCFTLCVSMYNCVMPNLTRGVSFVGTAMGNYGIGNFAASLGTASGAQNVTVTGTPFGALLTAADATAVAHAATITGKGFTIVN